MQWISKKILALYSNIGCPTRWFNAPEECVVVNMRNIRSTLEVIMWLDYVYSAVYSVTYHASFWLPLCFEQWASELLLEDTGKHSKNDLIFVEQMIKNVSFNFTWAAAYGTKCDQFRLASVIHVNPYKEDHIIFSLNLLCFVTIDVVNVGALYFIHLFIDTVVYITINLLTNFVDG